jgi:hypothetical protein
VQWTYIWIWRCGARQETVNTSMLRNWPWYSAGTLNPRPFQKPEETGSLLCKQSSGQHWQQYSQYAFVDPDPPKHTHWKCPKSTRTSKLLPGPPPPTVAHHHLLWPYGYTPPAEVSNQLISVLCISETCRASEVHHRRCRDFFLHCTPSSVQHKRRSILSKWWRCSKQERKVISQVRTSASFWK